MFKAEKSNMFLENAQFTIGNVILRFQLTILPLSKFSLPLWTIHWKVCNNKLICDYQEKFPVSTELAVTASLQSGDFTEMSWLCLDSFTSSYSRFKVSWFYKWVNLEPERISIFPKRFWNLRIKAMSLKSWLWISTNKPEVITVKQSISFEFFNKIFN